MVSWWWVISGRVYAGRSRNSYRYRRRPEAPKAEGCGVVNWSLWARDQEVVPTFYIDSLV